MQRITLDIKLLKLLDSNPFLQCTCNKFAYNSPTEASDYEIRKGLRDQLLFSFQFIKKPAKWNYTKVTNTSVLVMSKYTYNK